MNVLIILKILAPDKKIKNNMNQIYGEPFTLALQLQHVTYRDTQGKRSKYVYCLLNHFEITVIQEKFD